MEDFSQRYGPGYDDEERRENCSFVGQAHMRWRTILPGVQDASLAVLKF